MSGGGCFCTVFVWLLPRCSSGYCMFRAKRSMFITFWLDALAVTFSPCNFNKLVGGDFFLNGLHIQRIWVQGLWTCQKRHVAICVCKDLPPDGVLYWKKAHHFYITETLCQVLLHQLCSHLVSALGWRTTVSCKAIVRYPWKAACHGGEASLHRATPSE